MFRRVAAAFTYRRLVRELSVLNTTLATQTTLLARLADHFAPATPAADRVTVTSDTGLTHLDDTEAGLALGFIERTRQATGHVPDDDEVLIYLADEKTTDLHKRLTEREAELQRLEAARSW